jgi:pyrroline-5-carboxylate reductase
MKLGFIGCGKMATALAHGVLQSGLCAPTDVALSDAVPAVAEALARNTGARVVANNDELVAACDTVILAVKPHDAIAAIQAIHSGGMESSMSWAWRTGGDQASKLLLSIVAGLPLAKLEAAATGRFRVIRAMPNTPALVLRGATAYAAGSKATPEDLQLANQIFGSVGLAVPVKESLLDAVTGLSGSGPAYIYMVIEALADGGVLMGLPRDLALQLAAQTVSGAAEMVLGSASPPTMTPANHPAVLRDQVTSPGGTTAAALETLEQRGLRAALIAAVRAATERAHQLGAS